MPVFIGELPAMGLNSLLFVGKVTRRQAIDFPHRIDPESPTVGSRWITVFDAGADLSEVDAEALLEIKAKLAPILRAIAKGGLVKSVLVSASAYNTPLVACWRTMTATDSGYPNTSGIVETLPAACEAHGLTGQAARTVQAWIEGDLMAARMGAAA